MYEIKVAPFGDVYECEPDETLLAAALRNGLYLRYGCKHGGCGTCKVQLADGDVDLTASVYSLPPNERDAGTILVCQSYPLEDCVIDATTMNLDAEEFRKGDQTGEFTLSVTSVEALTHDIRRVVLAHAPGVRVPFVAGQFVNVTVPGTDAARSYSMANGSADDDRIELICKLLPGGAFSGFLADGDPVGTDLRVTGPFGRLAIRLSHREIIMVAGGSGLAPLLAMLKDLARKGSTRRVTLFFGARTAADLYALDEIAALQILLPGLTFVPVVGEAAADWTGATGLVTEGIVAARADWSGYDAYLCGPPAMIDAVTELIIARGVRPQNIHFDAFVSTGDTASIS